MGGNSLKSDREEPIDLLEEAQFLSSGRYHRIMEIMIWNGTMRYSAPYFSSLFLVLH
jgi:hypothetical protein